MPDVTLTFYGGPEDGLVLRRDDCNDDYFTAAPLNGTPCVYEIFGNVAFATTEETSLKILSEMWR